MDRIALRAELAWRSRWMARRLRRLPPGLYVFNCHRIGNPRDTLFDPNVFSCDADALDDHLKAIGAYFEVISPDELDAATAAGNRRCALLTFDDGYRDNFTQALPVLQAHGLGAIFFICTGFLESNALPWWDRIAFMVRYSTRDEVSINGKTLTLRGRAVGDAIREVLREFKLVPGKSAEKLAELEIALSPSQAMPDQALFMTWSDLREAKRQGICIGSHTLTHDKMAHLSDEEQRRELADSKRLLDRQLEQNTLYLAYPVGGLDSFNDETRRLARECGYRFAFTTEQHRNPWTGLDGLAIGRFSISASRPAVTLHHLLGNVKATGS